jgi:hypothetical protein
VADIIVGKIVFHTNNDRCKCNGDGSELCKTCLRNLAPCGDYQTHSQFSVVNGKCNEYINAYPVESYGNPIKHRARKTIKKRGNSYHALKFTKADFGALADEVRAKARRYDKNS